MRFVEETGAAWTAEQLKAAEAEIEAQKREWEANRLAALQKEEEMLKREAAEEGPEDLITYSRRDANNQVVNKSKQKEQGSTLRKSNSLSSNSRTSAAGTSVKTMKRNRENSKATGQKNKPQTPMRNRVLLSRTKFGNRLVRRNMLNKLDEKNDNEEAHHQHITRSAKSAEKDKELPTVSNYPSSSSSVQSKTGVKNQKLLNIARRKQIQNMQNCSSIKHKFPTKSVAVLVTDTKRVLRNNTIRQTMTTTTTTMQEKSNNLNKNKLDEKNNRVKNINTHIVNFRNKLRSESCKSSEHSEQEEEQEEDDDDDDDNDDDDNEIEDKSNDDEQATDKSDESDLDDECNGVIRNTQENTNSTTYYNVSEESEVEKEEEEEDDDENENENESSVSDKPSQKGAVGKKSLKSMHKTASIVDSIENETPRTRSRGTVNIDLWTLDNSLLSTSFHANVSRSSKKDTNEQNNITKKHDNNTTNDTIIDITAIDKKSKVILKRRKTDDHESSRSAKITTLDHWLATKKNGPPSNPNTYHENET